MYILINGVPKGFFDISRGLRQGGPISPLLHLDLILMAGHWNCNALLLPYQHHGVSVLLFVICYGGGSLWHVLKLLPSQIIGQPAKFCDTNIVPNIGLVITIIISNIITNPWPLF